MNRQRITGSQRRWLLNALSEWQAEGVLSAEQANQIMGLYETEGELGKRKRSKVMFALLGMAALLFGLAVLLVVAFNWELISRQAKLAIILVGVTGTHALGFFLWAQHRAKLAEVVFFFGCLSYGSGIWLIAQAFHIEAHYPDGFWWWAVGVLPFALCLDSLLCHLLFVCLMAIWAGSEVLGFGHLRTESLLNWWQWPNGAYSLPFLALPGLVWGYRKGSPLTVGLLVALLSWWVILQADAWGAGERSAFFIGATGAILMILAEAHPQGSSMSSPYRWCGTLLVIGALGPLSSYWFWEDWMVSRPEYLPSFAEPSAFAVAITLVLAILTLLCMTCLLLVLIKQREGLTIDQRHELFGRLAFPVGVAICLAGLAFWSAWVTTPASARFPSIIANVIALGLVIYLLRVGVREDRAQAFFAGVLYFMIWALVRFIDLFSSDGGMLRAAAIFLLCGLGLVALAWYWSKSRVIGPERDIRGGLPYRSFVPAWVEAIVCWVLTQARPILIISTLGHVLVLGGLIIVQAIPLLVGETILLRVNPVDPRDLFRGDYVILSYEINRLDQLSVDGAPSSPTELLDTPMADRQVYVSLELEADGKHWHAVRASLQRPKVGKYICGRYTGEYWQPIRFGIEAYYVQEGKGQNWNKLQNANKLSAEIALAPWGQAKLRRLIDEE